MAIYRWTKYNLIADNRLAERMQKIKGGIAGRAPRDSYKKIRNA